MQRQLRGLTFRDESAIIYSLRNEPNAMCFVQFVGKRVASWGVLFETRHPPALDYMTFTRLSDRRKGYGARVILAAREYRLKHHRGKKVNTYKASDGAKALYDKYSFYEA